VTNSRTALGTTPPGTSNEKEAAAWVQQMFGRVAPRYDFLNHLLSFNIDRYWRKRLLNRVRPVLIRPDAVVVDLCCGTGDVLLDLQNETPSQVIGVDFCHPMLVRAGEKIQAHRIRSALAEADAMRLPFHEKSLDLITIAFGFRNLVNYEVALGELFRVLKPGGMLAILEFSHPRGRLFPHLYRVYSEILLPTFGGSISGSREAYQYLPDSIQKFPRAEQLSQMMADRGFQNVKLELLTSGIAALHTGEGYDGGKLSF
jgi:demethylmenaquinone methyltransferase/2-methoxy-6-polyprenyl-1,4-benzoquinol methylase